MCFQNSSGQIRHPGMLDGHMLLKDCLHDCYYSNDQSVITACSPIFCLHTLGPHHLPAALRRTSKRQAFILPWIRGLMAPIDMPFEAPAKRWWTPDTVAVVTGGQL